MYFSQAKQRRSFDIIKLKKKNVLRVKLSRYNVEDKDATFSKKSNENNVESLNNAK